MPYTLDYTDLLKAVLFMELPIFLKFQLYEKVSFLIYFILTNKIHNMTILKYQCDLHGMMSLCIATVCYFTCLIM